MGVARIFSGGGHFFKKFSKNMQKNYKNFVKKIAKNGFLSIFFKKFNKPSIQNIFKKIFLNFQKNIKKL